VLSGKCEGIGGSGSGFGVPCVIARLQRNRSNHVRLPPTLAPPVASLQGSKGRLQPPTGGANQCSMLELTKNFKLKIKRLAVKETLFIEKQ
jgi:hypothetical protein